MKLVLMFFVALVLALTGCAAEDQMVRPSSSIPGAVYVSKPVLPSKPDPAKLGETPPFLSVGTKYIFRQANAITKNWVPVTWIIMDRMEWQGRDAYKIDMGDRYQILDNNLNFLAMADKEGKVISAAVPFIRVYNWPLKVGATYTTSYDYYVGGKKILGVNDPITVESMMSVIVPAGQFSTFVVTRTSVVSTEKIYYAPSVGFPAKWHISQSVDHPNGPGETIVELVKIEK